jgi:hypothetical protein
MQATAKKSGRARGKKPAAEGYLNATYADIPAPRWDWEEMPAAPVPRLDGYSVQIGDLLYVFAGYENLDHVRIPPSYNSTLSLQKCILSFTNFLLSVHLNFRCILMLMCTISLPTHGRGGLICPRRWQIHI